jgi:hypothetical protein
VGTSGSVIAITSLALALTAAPALAADWYVAPGGSGSGTGPGNPFGRIQQAIGAAQAGDVIHVAAGTYQEALDTVRSGQAGRPIVIRGEGSVVVTVSGTVLRVDQPHVTVEHLVLDGQYASAPVVSVSSAGSFLVLRGVEVRRASRDCVSMGAPAGVLVENTRIHHCLNAAGGRTDAHGIVGGAVRDFTIRGSEIFQFSGDGIQFDPSRAAPGWDNVLVEDCSFWLAPLPAAENGFPAGTIPGENAIDTKTYTGGGRARLVIRRTRASGFGPGLIANMAAFNLKEQIDAVIDGVTVWDSEIAFRLRNPALVTVQNAVVHDVTTGVRYEDGISNLKVWNSTFGGGLTRAFQSASSSGSVLDVRNVLILGSSRPSQASGPSNLAVSASAFVDAARHDYRLSGTAAVDVGVTLAGVMVDRDGVARPQGAAYDVGAYEWCSGGCAGAPPPSPPAAPRNLRIIRGSVP